MHSGIQNVHAFPHGASQRHHSDRHQRPAQKATATASASATTTVVLEDEDPSISELVRAGEVLVSLGERHSKSKDNALAEVCYLRALDVFSKALPSYHPKTASTRDNLASLYRQRGQLSVAESLQRTAAADLRKHFGSNPHPLLARVLRNLAETCLLGGKVQEGLKILAEAMQVSRELSADHADHVVEIHRYHAQVMARLG
jgi:tetratricopeptide (TPR) repeat protein